MAGMAKPAKTMERVTAQIPGENRPKTKVYHLIYQGYWADAMEKRYSTLPTTITATAVSPILACSAQSLSPSFFSSGNAAFDEEDMLRTAGCGVPEALRLNFMRSSMLGIASGLVS